MRWCPSGLVGGCRRSPTRRTLRSRWRPPVCWILRGRTWMPGRGLAMPLQRTSCGRNGRCHSGGTTQAGSRGAHALGPLRTLDAPPARPANTRRQHNNTTTTQQHNTPRQHTPARPRRRLSLHRPCRRSRLARRHAAASSGFPHAPLPGHGSVGFGDDSADWGAASPAPATAAATAVGASAPGSAAGSAGGAAGRSMGPTRAGSFGERPAFAAATAAAAAAAAEHGFDDEPAFGPPSPPPATPAAPAVLPAVPSVSATFSAAAEHGFDDEPAFGQAAFGQPALSGAPAPEPPGSGPSSSRPPSDPFIAQPSWAAGAGTRPTPSPSPFPASSPSPALAPAPTSASASASTSRQASAGLPPLPPPPPQPSGNQLAQALPALLGAADGLPDLLPRRPSSQSGLPMPTAPSPVGPATAAPPAVAPTAVAASAAACVAAAGVAAAPVSTPGCVPPAQRADGRCCTSRTPPCAPARAAPRPRHACTTPQPRSPRQPQTTHPP
jgi:hypothetical protein